jgi:hypothetical protein
MDHMMLWVKFSYQERVPSDFSVFDLVKHYLKGNRSATARAAYTTWIGGMIWSVKRNIMTVIEEIVSYLLF